MNRKQAYALVKRYANTSDALGLKKPRSILLLWFLRNVVGLDDLDAYEFVCDGDADRGVDGIYLEPGENSDDQSILTLYQCKYPNAPSSVGPSDMKNFIGTAVSFTTAPGLRALLKGKVEPELRRLIDRYNLLSLLEEDAIELRLVFVTAGYLHSDADELVAATNHKHGEGYLKVYDVTQLGKICEALDSVKPVSASIKVNCPPEHRFTTKSGTGKVVVGAIRAKDVVNWPGIEDRSLFDLNVRRELPKNRVRKELNRAIGRATDHSNFIAFHNGLTVVCTAIDDSGEVLEVTDFSVVNGAQSVIAFHANRSSVTDDLCIVAKFVELGSHNPVAREVARRSNMQNPVNARNLRALDGRQLVISEEFRTRFASVYYETRPDTKTPACAERVIKNDDAAQLLCALFHEQPWLAVKRLALFEDHYPMVFGSQISAEHIVLADLVRRRVEAAKSRFPDDYVRSWSLTALVAVYLVGQLLRSTDDLEAILHKPAEALDEEDSTVAVIDDLVGHVSGTLNQRHVEKHTAKNDDDFKVDFKNEKVLRALGKTAQSNYAYHLGQRGS